MDNSSETEVGVVSGYFANIEVVTIKLSRSLKIGDKVHIKGTTTDFETEIKGMQINRKEVKTAKKGDHIGIKVPEKVRPNDKVLLLK